ncbi:hypothetical protein BLNAU_10893 [Blattamonas nauphoetae]|uniref:Uncharacterized protein n=1 Tax=Blattamonas nauphoetae TaxID=2049346 RepID=A0ABQ9XPU3_9EUKA|nr:hypothetical protein BLNAU_10893 [Blattamonas nauphoetae]
MSEKDCVPFVSLSSSVNDPKVLSQKEDSQWTLNQLSVAPSTETILSLDMAHRHDGMDRPTNPNIGQFVRPQSPNKQNIEPYSVDQQYTGQNNSSSNSAQTIGDFIQPGRASYGPHLSVLNQGNTNKCLVLPNGQCMINSFTNRVFNPQPTYDSIIRFPVVGRYPSGLMTLQSQPLTIKWNETLDFSPPRPQKRGRRDNSVLETEESNSQNDFKKKSRRVAKDSPKTGNVPLAEPHVILPESDDSDVDNLPGADNMDRQDICSPSQFYRSSPTSLETPDATDSFLTPLDSTDQYLKLSPKIKKKPSSEASDRRQIALAKSTTPFSAVIHNNLETLTTQKADSWSSLPTQHSPHYDKFTITCSISGRTDQEHDGKPYRYYHVSPCRSNDPKIDVIMNYQCYVMIEAEDPYCVFLENQMETNVEYLALVVQVDKIREGDLFFWFVELGNPVQEHDQPQQQQPVIDAPETVVPLPTGQFTITCAVGDRSVQAIDDRQFQYYKVYPNRTNNPEIDVIMNFQCYVMIDAEDPYCSQLENHMNTSIPSATMSVQIDQLHQGNLFLWYIEHKNPTPEPDQPQQQQPVPDQNDPISLAAQEKQSLAEKKLVEHSLNV